MEGISRILKVCKSFPQMHLSPSLLVSVHLNWSIVIIVWPHQESSNTLNDGDEEDGDIGWHHWQMIDLEIFARHFQIHQQVATGAAY